MTETEKFKAKIASIKTPVLVDLVRQSTNQYGVGYDEIFDFGLVELERRLPSADFVEFCNSLG